MNIFVFKDNSVHGPYPDIQLVLLIRDGIYSDSDLGALEGTERWLPLREMLSGREHSTDMPPQHPSYLGNASRKYIKPICIALAVVGGVLIAIGFSDLETYWFLSILGAIPCIFLFSSISSACPKCHEWWVKKKIRTSEVGREPLAREETKYDRVYKTNDPHNSAYHQTIERRETVYFTRTYFHHLNQCSYCEHEWLTKSHEDSN